MKVPTKVEENSKRTSTIFSYGTANQAFDPTPETEAEPPGQMSTARSEVIDEAPEVASMASTVSAGRQNGLKLSSSDNSYDESSDDSDDVTPTANTPADASADEQVTREGLSTFYGDSKSDESKES